MVAKLLYGCKKFAGILHYMAIFHVRPANGKVPRKEFEFHLCVIQEKFEILIG